MLFCIGKINEFTACLDVGLVLLATFIFSAKFALKVTKSDDIFAKLIFFIKWILYEFSIIWIYLWFKFCLIIMDRFINHENEREKEKNMSNL